MYVCVWCTRGGVLAWCVHVWCGMCRTGCFRAPSNVACCPCGHAPQGCWWDRQGLPSLIRSNDLCPAASGDEVSFLGPVRLNRRAALLRTPLPHRCQAHGVGGPPTHLGFVESDLWRRSAHCDRPHGDVYYGWQHPDWEPGQRCVWSVGERRGGWQHPSRRVLE